MRKSSQIGIGIAIGIAIFSASSGSKISSDREWYSLWSQANAGIASAAAAIAGSPEPREGIARRSVLPSKIRRRALFAHVQEKLGRRSEAVASILP